MLASLLPRPPGDRRSHPTILLAYKFGCFPLKSRELRELAHPIFLQAIEVETQTRIARGTEHIYACTCLVVEIETIPRIRAKQSNAGGLGCDHLGDLQSHETVSGPFKIRKVREPRQPAFSHMMLQESSLCDRMEFYVLTNVSSHRGSRVSTVTGACLQRVLGLCW